MQVYHVTLGQMSLCSSLIKYHFSLIWQDSQSISLFGHLFLIYVYDQQIIMNSWYDQPQIFIEASFHNYTDKEPHIMDMQPSSYIIIRFKMIINVIHAVLVSCYPQPFLYYYSTQKSIDFSSMYSNFAALIKTSFLCGQGAFWPMTSSGENEQQVIPQHPLQRESHQGSLHWAGLLSSSARCQTRCGVALVW